MRYAMVLVVVLAGCDRELTPAERAAIDERERVQTAKIHAEHAQAKAKPAADAAAHKAKMAELTRPKTKAEKAAIAKQAIADRKAMADGLEKTLREGGYVVMVTTRGKDHTRMVIKWDGCTAPWLDTLTDDGEVLMALRRVGFKRVDCETSYDVSYVKL